MQAVRSRLIGLHLSPLPSPPSLSPKPVFFSLSFRHSLSYSNKQNPNNPNPRSSHHAYATQTPNLRRRQVRPNRPLRAALRRPGGGHGRHDPPWLEHRARLGPYAGDAKIKEVEFVKSSGRPKDCPRDSRPEFAMLGRSNVGKSSLINALVRKKDVALTSKKPGKTQLINHFLVNNSWYIVDLPGYG
ncbi:P-loop containing nucleoside triphosphate hydrolases superfamily protein [Actinidia rufa]|uniref:P-loop containing nucleoside triphosphate hydrolases superfamily protein n=1 Tax=Actinidia rufa TaxID=165716 RepID=A0A7J0E554_9ERIC|nr:P-loop containing nucleoside triphosphate hydrolases superfamily protein [Actinidia rufa]